jgi:hypothetical protein
VVFFIFDTFFYFSCSCVPRTLGERQITTSSGDHISKEGGNCSWNGMHAFLHQKSGCIEMKIKCIKRAYLVVIAMVLRFPEFKVAEYQVTKRHIFELSGIDIFLNDILPNRQIVKLLSVALPQP